MRINSSYFVLFKNASCSAVGGCTDPFSTAPKSIPGAAASAYLSPVGGNKSAQGVR
jgi:hypothetical protein